MNALNIRRKYHRNMQLYMLVREKMLVERNVVRQLANGGGASAGFTNSSMTESRSMTEDQDDEASSSFASSSMDASVSYDNGHGHGAVGLINPSDMIMEQSNDDDDSYVDQRPRRCVDLLGDQENISLIEDDYIIVDPITEQYRASQTSLTRNQRPSFFEENLMMMNTDQQPSSAKNSTTSSQLHQQQLQQSMMSSGAGGRGTTLNNTTVATNTASNNGSEGGSSPQVNVHVSQLNAPGLTDCSEDEKEEDESNRSFDS